MDAKVHKGGHHEDETLAHEVPADLLVLHEILDYKRALEGGSETDA